VCTGLEQRDETEDTHEDEETVHWARRGVVAAVDDDRYASLVVDAVVVAAAAPAAAVPFATDRLFSYLPAGY